MRGNQCPYQTWRVFPRSIPAHAGQPPFSLMRSTSSRVYPRACGATVLIQYLSPHRRGLSPRMRGNLELSTDELLWWRSIPAHAGQPALIARKAAAATVYPRACGATPLLPMRCGYLPGSIPAHAGQPATRGRMLSATTVYPRACGATANRDEPKKRSGGLSPRMRGNPSARRMICFLQRSIPAHAGQPRIFPKAWGCTGVYPRACGATNARGLGTCPSPGLSPRMRGNQ